MRSRTLSILAAFAALSLALTACGFGNIPSLSGGQPTQITGTFAYTNDIITTYYVENAVALVDMYGFVKRDKEWVIPVNSQTLGFLQIDPKTKTGKYSLELPAAPMAQMVDVDNNGKKDKGVQVFAVCYWPNLTGGPYSEGDDPTRGWPNYLASVKVDSANKDEVTGGKLVVWAPDANEKFPTGFGADGRESYRASDGRAGAFRDGACGGDSRRYRCAHAVEALGDVFLLPDTALGRVDALVEESLQILPIAGFAVSSCQGTKLFGCNEPLDVSDLFGRLDATQLFDVGFLGAFFAQFFLDGSHLLAKDVFALLFAHFGLSFAGNFVPQLQNLDLVR